MARTKKFIVHPTDDKLAQFPPEVRKLVKKGREQGFVTQQELMKAIPNIEDDLLLLDEIYSLFLDLGIDVLLDDRDERPGIKFADMELIGLPYQIIVGSKGLQQNQVEIKIRTPETKGQTKANQDISIDAVIEFISNTL